MTIVECPKLEQKEAGGAKGGVPGGQKLEVMKKLITQSMNNLDSKEGPSVAGGGVINKGNKDVQLEKQSSMSDTSSTDSPTRMKPRFSSVSPKTPHLRRMSFPALRRGSSMDVVHADMDELIANHSPEVKRRMRLLRH